MEQTTPFSCNPAAVTIRRNLAVEHRKIFINDEITADLCNEIMYYLYSIVDMDKKAGTKDPIEVIINTNGGSAYDGMMVVSFLESMKDDGYEIITTNAGAAFSMGFLLSLIGTKRKAYRYSSYMRHSVAGGCFGKYQTVKEDFEQLEHINNIGNELLMKYTNIDLDTIKEWDRCKVDKYFSADEALKLGIVDEVV